MSKSAPLRAADVRAIYHLVGECRDLGDDPVVWRRHWFSEAAKLTGAALGIGGEASQFRSGQFHYLGAADWGWENGFNRAAWETNLAELHRDPASSRIEALQLYVRRVVQEQGVALARTDLLTDRDWDRSWNYQHLQKVAGVNHTVWCFDLIPSGNGDEWSGYLLSRAVGQRDFTAREKAMIRELHAALVPLIGGPLARFSEPSPTALPPRTRQVLRCLLEGDSDKQVATRLGLSRYTVNEYVDRIFRHFGVQSRPELLARWIRRGWGSRFVWADSDRTKTGS